MDRNEELREDLFRLGEPFPAGAHGLILAEFIVQTGQALNINPNKFLSDVSNRFNKLSPMFEDMTLLEPPSEQETERYRRLAKDRIRRFTPGPTLDSLNVLLASLSDVVMRRGLPPSLALNMLVSIWTGTPLKTNISMKLPRKKDLNGLH